MAKHQKQVSTLVDFEIGRCVYSCIQDKEYTIINIPTDRRLPEIAEVQTNSSERSLEMIKDEAPRRLREYRNPLTKTLL